MYIWGTSECWQTYNSADRTYSDIRTESTLPARINNEGRGKKIDTESNYLKNRIIYNTDNAMVMMVKADIITKLKMAANNTRDVLWV